MKPSRDHQDLILISKVLDPIIDGMQKDIIGAVRESIQIDSTAGLPTQAMPFGEGPAKALQQALTVGEKLGFRVKNINNTVGYAEFGTGAEMIAALGHLDVVPAGDGWKYPPFAGELHDDILWGRGSLDDKGPIIGALFAMKAIEASGLNISRRIRVIFGTNEESGSKDMPVYCAAEEAPVMGFTPDASYPVIFAEKGILTLSLSKPVIQKKEHTRLLRLSGGTAANIVPDQAEAIVSFGSGPKKKYEGLGLSSHGSTPEAGKNAIISLLNQIKNLDFSPDLKAFIVFLSEKIGEETDGTSMGLQMRDDPSGSLTLNLATIGLLENNDSHRTAEEAPAQEINAKINIRYPVTKGAEEILQIIKRHAAGTGIQVTVLSHKEPLYVDEDCELIKKLEHAYEACTGEKAGRIAIGGGTYAKAMKNIVAFGPLFPGQEDVTHQVDEHISVEDLIKNVKIMAAAMYILANK